MDRTGLGRLSDKVYMTLHGKHALVTGSTSGIGLGIARLLAQQGCKLTINGFGESHEITNLCVELTEAGADDVIHSAADMRKPDQIKTMIEESIEHSGRLDILVNNAGIQHVSPIE